MQILLANGATVSFKLPFHGRAPLQCAIRLCDQPSAVYEDACAKVKILLEYRAEPAMRGCDEEASRCLALRSASSRGYTEIVKLLLDHGAYINERRNGPDCINKKQYIRYLSTP